MNRFWFAPEGPRRPALMRIGLGLVLWCELGPRWRHAVELYSASGPAMPAFRAPAGADPAPLGWTPPASVAALAASGLLFTLVTAAVGWRTGQSLWMSAGLLAWLASLDVAATLGKHTVLAVHLLALLALGQAGGAWSVDAWRAGARACACPLSAAWPRRLMQMLVCAIYLGAALTKLATPSFLTGDLLEFSLLDRHWGGGAIGLWLSRSPEAVRLLSLATLLFELLFPFLVWVRPLRRPVLVAAVAVHAGMGLALHLEGFMPLMLVALVAFLDERDLPARGLCVGATFARGAHVNERCPADGGATTAAGLCRRLGSGWLAAAAACAAVGLGIQWHCDWYGAFERRPPEEFALVSDAEWAEMEAARLPAWEDYVHRVTVGRRAAGTHVSGGAEGLRAGERLYVLVQLLPQHPDMRVEGILLAPDGREAGRFRHAVAAGVTHSLNTFELTDELSAGEYRLIVQVEGYEVTERRVSVAAAR